MTRKKIIAGNWKMNATKDEAVALVNGIIANYSDYNLSENKSLPWSVELIEKFADKWEWGRLSRDNSLPWSINSIHKSAKNLTATSSIYEPLKPYIDNELIENFFTSAYFKC